MWYCIFIVPIGWIIPTLRILWPFIWHHHMTHTFGLHWTVLTGHGWTGIKFGTTILTFIRMNCNNFGGSTLPSSCIFFFYFVKFYLLDLTTEKEWCPFTTNALSTLWQSLTFTLLREISRRLIVPATTATAARVMTLAHSDLETLRGGQSWSARATVLLVFGQSQAGQWPLRTGIGHPCHKTSNLSHWFCAAKYFWSDLMCYQNR